jgi:glucose/mannose-6-phosphate isomerase
MNEHISDFTKHLAKALEIGKSVKFMPSKNQINNVLVCGLGGSGIGGSIISQMIKSEIKVPVTVNKDYFIPEFVDESTLVICCSYSGNTEETLKMYELAAAKGAEIAVSTSGGKFEELAKTKGYNMIVIPGGLPPRAAFGLGFPQLFFILEKYGLISDSFITGFEKSILMLDLNEENIKASAKEIAIKFDDKIPVIYSGPEIEGVCVRFKQQINENSKRLAWNSSIPEMNHNEIVGWRRDYSELAVVFFKTNSDYYRNVEREKYLKKVISSYNNNVTEIVAKGDTLLEQTMYLIHFGDWISELFGNLNKVDTTEVDVITGLKNILADLD